MNTIAATMMMAVLFAPGDPPTANVVGDLVTINADIAWFVEPLPPGAALIQGTTLAGVPSLAASSDGVGPIVWRLPPGTYTITAFGYPVDRLNPQRIEGALSVTVDPPDRATLIRGALLQYSASVYQTQLAKQELITLAPTLAEIRTAILIP